MRHAPFVVALLFSLTYADPCPDGYTQRPTGGDCYQALSFYDYFATQFIPKTFDEAEAECNMRNGGLLASIHSDEDVDAISYVHCGQPTTRDYNIGLRCTGKVCRWDDGSPVTYTFFNGDGPTDDGKLRCYRISGTYPFYSWIEKSCGQQKEDCWICKVKARTIDCTDDETEYKGGCISVHTSPLDQRSAEASCPGGGHLVSIHSVGAYTENDFYKQLAIAAGVNGTIYIGGQFSNGLFEWTDGSYYNAAKWANGFPSTIFGTCVQMLLASEFGSQGQWTNIDCSVQQPYMCFRDGAVFPPSVAPPPPKANPICPPIQYYTGSGSIYSPNYPVSVPNNQTCEYVLATDEGTKASIKFLTFNVRSGANLTLYDGLNSYSPIEIFNDQMPTINRTYSCYTSNVMKIVFTAKDTHDPVGTGWEAVFPAS